MFSILPRRAPGEPDRTAFWGRLRKAHPRAVHKCAPPGLLAGGGHPPGRGKDGRRATARCGRDGLRAAAWAGRRTVRRCACRGAAQSRARRGGGPAQLRPRYGEAAPPRCSGGPCSGRWRAPPRPARPCDGSGARPPERETPPNAGAGPEAAGSSCAAPGRTASGPGGRAADPPRIESPGALAAGGVTCGAERAVKPVRCGRPAGHPWDTGQRRRATRYPRPRPTSPCRLPAPPVTPS